MKPSSTTQNPQPSKPQSPNPLTPSAHHPIHPHKPEPDTTPQPSQTLSTPYLTNHQNNTYLPTSSSHLLPSPQSPNSQSYSSIFPRHSMASRNQTTYHFSLHIRFCHRTPYTSKFTVAIQVFTYAFLNSSANFLELGGGVRCSCVY